MGDLALNKSSLKLERDRLKTFARFLPSLDLKRQQLMVEFKKAQKAHQATQEEVKELLKSLEGLLELLGASTMDLSNYVKLQKITVEEENVVGVRLPALKDLEFQLEEYSTLAKPFWVDALIDHLQKASELRIRAGIEQKRVDLLDDAVRKITQRVNLFEKVLIPGAKENIHRIRIFLGDAERAAVVRSKLVKSKNRRTPSERKS
jgi:V/A-type H+/Na+-transporting ATPase subunit D